MSETTYAGIEAGGTKFMCVVGTGPYYISQELRIDTTSPDETLAKCLDFFGAHPGFVALGIASFGPLELRRGNDRFGQVTETPKPGWTGADLVGPIRDAFDVPVAIDTDVNGAALAEARWGAAAGLSNALYLTVGTGIGGGAVIDGKPVHGLVHPEMGHVSVQRAPDDTFPGICPFHGDCLEGLASGPAIQARWGRPADELGADTTEAVDIESATLASGIRQFVYVLAPERVIIGGGVAQLPGLHAAVQAKLLSEMAGYGVQPEHRRRFVVPPGLGDRSGVAGALALAVDVSAVDISES